MTVATGIISTIAGSSSSGAYSGDNGQATSAKLNYPESVAVDTSGRLTLPYIINIYILFFLLPR